MKKYIALFIVLVLSCLFNKNNSANKINKIDNDTNLYVIVQGAIEKEKKISFTLNETIRDLVSKISLSNDVYLECINLDVKLYHEQVVYFPIFSSKVNLNTAGFDELKLIKGVGNTIAERIITYRTYSPFMTIEDIMKVAGIGEKTYLKLRDQVCI